MGAVFGGFNAGATLRRQDAVLVFPKVWTGAIGFGLIGLLMDWVHKSRTTIYRAPPQSVSVTMVLLTAPGRYRLAVSLRF